MKNTFLKLKKAVLQKKSLLVISYYLFSSLNLLSVQVFGQDSYQELSLPYPKNNFYALLQVQKYRDKYSSPAFEGELFRILENGEIYRLYIRRELKKRNMPKELEYLPVVESEYKTKAVSKSGASGLWQFMENSIEGLLKKDEWVDERFDPFLETEAALKKLSDNYKMFNDWALALAAYNCGAGALKRILKNVDEKENQNFWYISEHGLLRDQSIEYVPKLIAISDIVENTSYFKTNMPDTKEKESYFNENHYFDYYITESSMTFDRISEMTGIDSSIIEELNPALIKKCTPPYKYKLRLPN